MDFKIIQTSWPIAHPNWKIILRKKNGKTYIKEKKKEKTNVFPVHRTIQTTQRIH